MSEEQAKYNDKGDPTDAPAPEYLLSVHHYETGAPVPTFGEVGFMDIEDARIFFQEMMGFGNGFTGVLKDKEGPVWSFA